MSITVRTVNSVRNFHPSQMAFRLVQDKFGDVAGDFTVQQLDGSSWTFSEKWTGCESYVFLRSLI